jgi:hypothetical protein
VASHYKLPFHACVCVSVDDYIATLNYKERRSSSVKERNRCEQIMITYEQDDDVLRWSFNPFHDPYANSAAYCGANVQHDGGFYNGCYAREGTQCLATADTSSFLVFVLLVSSFLGFASCGLVISPERRRRAFAATNVPQWMV